MNYPVRESGEIARSVQTQPIEQQTHTVTFLILHQKPHSLPIIVAIYAILFYRKFWQRRKQKGCVMQAAFRSLMIDQLERFQRALGSTINSIDVLASQHYRDGGTGWTVREVMGHLLDFERVFLQRFQMTLAEQQPVLPFPEPNQLVAQNNYNQQPLPSIYEQWAAQRSATIAFLKERSDGDWERLAQHPTRGLMSLLDQLVVTTWHDINHLEQINHILADQRTTA